MNSFRRWLKTYKSAGSVTDWMRDAFIAGIAIGEARQAGLLNESRLLEVLAAHHGESRRDIAKAIRGRVQ